MAGRGPGGAGVRRQRGQRERLPAENREVRAHDEQPDRRPLAHQRHGLLAPARPTGHPGVHSGSLRPTQGAQAGADHQGAGRVHLP